MATALAKSPFDSRLNGTRTDVSGGGVVISDLSALARTGFKGKGSTGWLSSKIGAMPDRPNRVAFQSDGAAVAWLGGEEYLILTGRGGKSDLVSQLEKDWPAGHKAAGAMIGYPLPRADSHSWLYMGGADVPAMMAKICGVDLRPEEFAKGDIAQTIVARIGSILIRDDKDGVFGLHMLTDFASADYLWDVLQDASAEFGGGFV